MATTKSPSAPRLNYPIDVWALSPGVMLDEQQVSWVTGLSVSALQKRRSRGQAPRFRRVGGRVVRYRAGAVAEWLDSQDEIGGDE